MAAHDNREIGERLRISPHTVAVYLHTILPTCRLKSRGEIKWCLDAVLQRPGCLKALKGGSDGTKA